MVSYGRARRREAADTAVMSAASASASSESAAPRARAAALEVEENIRGKSPSGRPHISSSTATACT